MSTKIPEFLAEVPLDKAFRLINHGPTVLVSSAHGGEVNVMAAAWSCPLDFKPPKVTVVIDKATRTRSLIEASGMFALQLPTPALAVLTEGVGTDSARKVPDKLQRHHVELFNLPGHEVPLVQGCVGWLMCRLVPEPHNQQTYDLFIGEVVAAWADNRVFSQGRWHFEDAPDALRTVHYVSGGQFYAIGESIKV
jgi:flavin reductase (DIM6/NTAB) family NADH-FMN oxidoreductase RutF